MDWDDDGDLDIWFKNRTGPQLRLFLNESPSRESAAHWLQLLLVGATPNTDAIGARVEVTTGSKVAIGSVRAGEGYLAAPSRRLHVGLGAQTRIDRVRVRWPDGTWETLEGLEADRRYRVVRSTTGPAMIEEVPRAPVLLPTDTRRSDPLPALRAPLVLRTPLPMPPGLLRQVGFVPGEPGGPIWIHLWAQWCEPCREELMQLSARMPEFARRGVKLVALNIDEVVDRNAAQRVAADLGIPFQAAMPGTASFVEILLSHIVADRQPLPVPISLLVDASGQLQLLYIGAAIPDRFLADAQRFAATPISASRRGIDPGRWFYRSPRNTMKLSGDLSEAGLTEEASFYRALP